MRDKNRGERKKRKKIRDKNLADRLRSLFSGGEREKKSGEE